MVRGFHPLGELLPGQPSVDVMPLEELDRPLAFRVRDADALLLPVVIHVHSSPSLSLSPRRPVLLCVPWSMMALPGSGVVVRGKASRLRPTEQTRPADLPPMRLIPCQTTMDLLGREPVRPSSPDGARHAVRSRTAGAAAEQRDRGHGPPPRC